MSFSRAWSSHRDGSWVIAFLFWGTVQLGAGSLVWGPAGGAVLRWKSGHLCFTPWKQGGKNARPDAGGRGGAALPFSTNSYLPCLIYLKEESKTFTTLDPASLAWLTEEPGPPEVTHTSQSPCSPESSQSSLAQEEEEEDQGRTRKRKQSGQSPARAGKQRMKEKEQENERKVAQLAEENERLKQEIERLTREVEATRRALIDRMVNLHQAWTVGTSTSISGHSWPFLEVSTDHVTSANDIPHHHRFSRGDDRKGSQRVYRDCTFIYYCPYPLKWLSMVSSHFHFFFLPLGVSRGFPSARANCFFRSKSLATSAAIWFLSAFCAFNSRTMLPWEEREWGNNSETRKDLFRIQLCQLPIGLQPHTCLVTSSVSAWICCGPAVVSSAAVLGDAFALRTTTGQSLHLLP